MASEYIPSARLAFQFSWPRPYLVLLVELSRTIVAVNPNFFSRKKTNQLLGLNALQLQNSDGDFGVKYEILSLRIGIART